MESKKAGKKGTFLILTGLLFLIAAMFLSAYNLWDESRAEQTRTIVLEKLKPETVKADQPTPDYKKYPDMEMPVKEIEGKYYIGVLEIPFLDLELPVISEWDYPNLKVSPCRYQGSAYEENLIIAAHNYKCHFGDIKSIPQGEVLIFTDMDGNVFEYEVIEMEILKATDLEAMETGNWDLTLFTCTYGGKDRVTLRCMCVE